MTANPPDVTGFDPDSGDVQPEGSLETLIARIEAEVRELHGVCPSCRTMTWWWRRCATSWGLR
ncbi:hypothetical protein ACFFGR_22335 [Arthrobacter liuii]|uniref:hypothetical protein n=1 Tax=Arthrobacter liuii TaxID=1476996 RepID=UPI00166DCF33|nr:hypothetical protein [Arthrobacter liuii]